MDEIAAITNRVISSSGTGQSSTPRTAPDSAVSTETPRQADAVDVNKAVEELKNLAALHNVNLNFSVHKASGRMVIKVIEAETNKVVREIPPEEILNLAVSLEKLAGHLLSTKA